MDFGRITVDEDLVLYLFGTPGQKRFDFMWEILSEGMLGFIVMEDSTRPETFREARSILETFRAYAPTPYVVAANKQDLDDAWEVEIGSSDAFMREHYEGSARLKNAGTVEVRNGEGATVLKAEQILIATGSAPIELPGLPFDGSSIISSTEALALSEVPARLLVVGAGVVGLELGSVWGRLGADVHVIEMLDHALPGLDREMSGALAKLLERQGLTFRFETHAQSAKVEKDGVHVALASTVGTETAVYDCVLVAVGRRAHTEGLGLGKVGVELDERGRIVVDAVFATSVPGIFAIGDVIAGPMLAHKAEEEGIAAVECMAGQAGHVNYETIPWVVYTHPELASVGMTEEAAREKERSVRVGRCPLRAIGRAHCLQATDGLAKVVADAKTDRILGVHILSARASDIIAEATMAMEFSSSAEDVARSVHAHPSMPEVIKEACLSALGRGIHVTN